MLKSVILHNATLSYMLKSVILHNATLSYKIKIKNNSFLPDYRTDKGHIHQIELL
jgi:hypothetical protein